MTDERWEIYVCRECGIDSPSDWSVWTDFLPCGHKPECIPVVPEQRLRDAEAEAKRLRAEIAAIRDDSHRMEGALPRSWADDVRELEALRAKRDRTVETLRRSITEAWAADVRSLTKERDRLRRGVGAVSDTHDPLTCELCHAEGMGAEIADHQQRLRDAEAEIERLKDKAAGAEMWRDQSRALATDVEALRAERDRLRRAVDTAHGVMDASQYVGGPSEREAWRTATAALGAVATQHVAAAHPETEAPDGE